MIYFLTKLLIMVGIGTGGGDVPATDLDRKEPRSVIVQPSPNNGDDWDGGFTGNGQDKEPM